MFEKFKKASKKKFFWVWFLALSALIITLLILTIGTIIQNLLLVSIVTGISLVVGFIIDLILLKRK